ncbi:ABC transporter ATP-binding protein/permease [Mycobacterium shimoidei]|uniref:Putative drug-transport transmembrane ATP-binding protein ABC transporter BacA [Mycobacterium tuberculosis H37Rv] n=1 Tax=Mycobacterium shimoidei TaxID=29313 RepID=A0A1E3T8R7_MYCSH|nr:ABC transporter ATP-binding protein/permease [Mycobacterium shimoidei]MCV7259031.1 ABC transporter ATP-binding protein/permease [Mycobacterium shimoidei]ODR10777.1 multidrug ABC transporter ATP-binding protein [Mycobacterium shimoidei]ORW83250.1 multidrug ABC transporter ATP-binding protein [Mycobacterium shimoidei]SRX95221.1 putative drug-transport transmembrane ATP-binding protein ABC transporter BacA [Mycobacterium tuberculosis H37Rv] [Mycobacterium shimoidei]
MELFKPSIDWGHALTESVSWIALAWATTAVCVVVVLVVLRFVTPWGHQFWRISGDYFIGRQSIPVWTMLGVLLLSVIINVRLTVLFSYQSNDLNSSVQTAVQGMATHNDAVKQSGVHGFWMSLLIFSIMAVLHVMRVMLDIYLTQRFIVAWRVWLTDRLTGDWLDGRSYYRARFIDATIDNPDQRIQQDIDIFTANVGPTPNVPSNGTGTTLLFGGIQQILTMISFTAILWNLSGTLTVFGVDMPRAMFWVVILYVFVVTIIAFWIGRPLIWLSFRNELTNAAFRYALVRLRDAAEAVGFYRGERAERVQLSQRFRPIIDNYLRYVNRTIGFAGWNLSASQAIVPLPWVLQAPRLFAGQIKFGDVIQTATAFGNIQEGLSFFRQAYDQFASYRAAIIRLYGLVEADEQARELPEIHTTASVDDAVDIEGLEVRTPDGDQLIDSLDVHLDSGDALVITGRSGSGKTTLLRSLAELWPYASGTLRRPDAENETMFLSQLPYVPLGDLRAVVSYPGSSGDIPDQQLRDMLVKVVLPHLVDRLDEEEDWAKVLSPGEQQRVAFARVLLTKPKAVFLDEATSALDEGLEMTLYQLLRNELPNTIVVSVSHRSTVEQHHDRRLQLLGEGRWQLSRVEDEPVQV